MLKWIIKNNVVSELFWNGENIINPWGIETADSWSFFSLEDSVGYRFKILSKDIQISDSKYVANFHIKMREGEWTLHVEDELVGNKILRSAKLKCLKDSYFMDFVVRFRFKNTFFNEAYINHQNINHTGANVYHQYPVKEAQLLGRQLNVKVKILEADCVDKFIPELYVRDHQDEWVLHARMIPISSDKNIIKLCSKYFKTSPLPMRLSNFLLSFKAIKTYLWYHAEHSPYKSKIARFFSPNAFPLVKLKKGQEIFWKVEVEINGD